MPLGREALEITRGKVRELIGELMEHRKPVAFEGEFNGATRSTEIGDALSKVKS